MRLIDDLLNVEYKEQPQAVAPEFSVAKLQFTTVSDSRTTGQLPTDKHGINLLSTQPFHEQKPLLQALAAVLPCMIDCYEHLAHFYKILPIARSSS